VKAASARKVTGYVAAWLVIAACAVALYQRAASVPEPMEPDELSRTARQLASDALEAQRLAQQLGTGQLTAHFARAQHEQISQDLDDIRKALDRPPPTGALARVERLAQAARRLDEVIKTVPSQMADAEAMARVSDDEGSIARDIQAGGGS